MVATNEQKLLHSFKIVKIINLINMLSNLLLYFTTQVINPDGVKVTNYYFTSQDEIGHT